MKIEDLQKYPKKINDQLLEFRVPSPIGSLALLHEVAELSSTGHLVGTGINQIRKRYSSIISINRTSYWSLTLFSRFARRRKKKNYSVSSMIDILIQNMNTTYNQEDLNENLTTKIHSSIAEENQNKNASIIGYTDLMAYFKRVYLYEDEEGRGSFEVFIPEITFHEIPLLREYLIALVEPELFDESGHLWHRESLFEKMDLNVPQPSPSLEKVEAWIRSEELDIRKEIEREVEFAKLDINIPEPSASAAKKMLENMRLFKHLENKDIDEFVERFEKLKDLSNRLGKYL